MCSSRLAVMPNSSICSLFVSVWTVNLLSCTLVASGVGRVGRGEGWSRGDRGVAREENRVAASALTARPRKVYMYFFDPDRPVRFGGVNAIGIECIYSIQLG